MNTTLSRLRSFGHSLLFPTVRTNRCDGVIHILAFVLMFIDHSGKMLFHNMEIMRILGRMAFPLFAYSLAVGVIFSHDSHKYLTRIALLALVSQPLYALGLAHENAAMYSVSFFKNPLLACLRFYLNSWQTPSILLSLCLALGILIAIREKNLILAIALYVLCERFAGSFDYGIHGIRLILLFYFFSQYPILFAIVSGGYLLWWSASTGSSYVILGQRFSMEVFALPAILFCALPLPRTFRLPRWLTYGFYPAHLLLLAILSKI